MPIWLSYVTVLLGVLLLVLWLWDWWWSRPSAANIARELNAIWVKRETDAIARYRSEQFKKGR